MVAPVEAWYGRQGQLRCVASGPVELSFGAASNFERSDAYGKNVWIS